MSVYIAGMLCGCLPEGRNHAGRRAGNKGADGIVVIRLHVSHFVASGKHTHTHTDMHTYTHTHSQAHTHCCVYLGTALLAEVHAAPNVRRLRPHMPGFHG